MRYVLAIGLIALLLLIIFLYTGEATTKTASYHCPAVSLLCSDVAALKGAADIALSQQAAESQGAAVITVTVDTDEVLSVVKESFSSAHVLLVELLLKLTTLIQ